MYTSQMLRAVDIQDSRSNKNIQERYTRLMHDADNRYKGQVWHQTLPTEIKNAGLIHNGIHGGIPSPPRAQNTFRADISRIEFQWDQQPKCNKKIQRHSHKSPGILSDRRKCINTQNHRTPPGKLICPWRPPSNPALLGADPLGG